MILIITHHW